MSYFFSSNYTAILTPTRLCSVSSLSSCWCRSYSSWPLNFRTKIKPGFITQESGTNCAKRNPLYIGLGTDPTILYVRMVPFVSLVLSFYAVKNYVCNTRALARVGSWQVPGPVDLLLLDLYVLRYPVFFIIILFIEGDQFKLFIFLKVINNACATQAVLSVLMNINSPDVQLGPTLQVNYNIMVCTLSPWIIIMIIHLNP